MLTVEIDLRGAEKMLANLARAGKDISPALRQFRPEFKEDIDSHFKAQQADGGGWPGWSRSYLDRRLSGHGMRLKRTKKGRKLLPGGLSKKGVRALRSMLGGLKYAFKWTIAPTYIEAKSRVAWASVHQYGGTAGKGSVIPARKFLWLGAGAITRLREAILLHLIREMERGR